MGDFKIIETQEQLDAIVTERVARAKESVRKEYEGWLSPQKIEERTKELEDKKSELEKQKQEASTQIAQFKNQIAEYDSKIAKYETDSAKTRIANEIGLSYEAVEYLKGENEEEIKKSAEKLKAIVGNKIAPPLADPEGDTSKNSEKAAYKKMLQAMKGE